MKARMSRMNFNIKLSSLSTTSTVLGFLYCISLGGGSSQKVMLVGVLGGWWGNNILQGESLGRLCNSIVVHVGWEHYLVLDDELML